MGTDLNDISSHIPNPSYTPKTPNGPTWKSQNNPLPQTRPGPPSDNITSRDTLYTLIKDRKFSGALQNSTIKSLQSPIEGNTIQIFNEANQTSKAKGLDTSVLRSGYRIAGNRFTIFGSRDKVGGAGMGSEVLQSVCWRPSNMGFGGGSGDNFEMLGDGDVEVTGDENEQVVVQGGRFGGKYAEYLRGTSGDKYRSWKESKVPRMRKYLYGSNRVHKRDTNFVKKNDLRAVQSRETESTVFLWGNPITFELAPECRLLKKVELIERTYSIATLDV
jgi:hypothetical protein